MAKHILTLVAVAGIILMMGCAAGPGVDPYSVGDLSRMPEENRPIDLRDHGLAGPDVVLHEGAGWTLWGKISASDPHGISIDKVEAGDTLMIETLSGVAYFSGKSGWWQVLSAIYKVTRGAIPTGSNAANAITAISEILPGDGDDDKVANASRPRDAYGRDLNDSLGRFAEKEGGIVICMPIAGGPMYAHGANHFTREGRASQPVRNDQRGFKPVSEMPGKCFPAARGTTTYEISGSGVLHIYAFDHNYRDNAGSYEIKLRIER